MAHQEGEARKREKRYRVVPSGAARVNPYDVAYGPDPYASEPGTRREVAFGDNYSHPNSPAAISEIIERGKIIENWLLILQCAEDHKQKQKSSAAAAAANATRTQEQQQPQQQQ